jgi:hypothetical protein
MRGSEMMEVCMSRFAEHRRAILLALEMHREWWLAGVHWWEYQTTGFFFLGCEGFFQRNSVHGSRMRILCGFYAKGQEFVRIRLEKRFPNSFKTMKIHMHKLRKSSQNKCKRYFFYFIAKIP